MAAIIDFSDGILYYHPTAASQPAKESRLPGLSDVACIELKWKWYTLTFDGFVDGKQVSLGIDTGMSGSVLARDGSTARDLVWYKPLGTVPSEKKAGDFTYANFTFGRNDFGRWKIYGLNMNYIYDLIKYREERLDGFIGQAELEKVAGILDCKNAILYYVPVKNGKLGK